MFGILLAHDGFFYGNPPVDAQTFIQDADSPVRFGMVEIIALVLENRRFAQDGKSVGKALGDEELAVIVFREVRRPVVSRPCRR